MATAVVVATVVQSDLSEAELRTMVLEQIRNNERELVATLAGTNGEANVVTAVLNVEEFMRYMLQRFPRPVDTAPAPVDAKPKTTVLTDDMTEIEFMNHILDQAQAAGRQSHPDTTLSEEDLQALEDEAIGEDFARNPFLY